MIAAGFLVAAAVFGGLWLMNLAGFRMRVPGETMARGRSQMTWVMAPIGLGCLVIGAVLMVGQVAGMTLPDWAGPYVLVLTGLVMWVASRLWPERLFPDAGWYRTMRRVYNVVGVASIVLLVAAPFIGR